MFILVIYTHKNSNNAIQFAQFSTFSSWSHNIAAKYHARSVKMSSGYQYRYQGCLTDLYLQDRVVRSQNYVGESVLERVKQSKFFFCLKKWSADYKLCCPIITLYRLSSNNFQLVISILCSYKEGSFIINSKLSK